MKRRHLLLVALSLILSICMCFGLAACSSCDDEETPTALATPVVTINNTGVASWEAVEHASKYAYKIDDGTEVETTELSRQLTDGQKIAVKAIGDGESYSDSEWSVAQTYTAPAPKPVTLGKPEVTIATDGTASWKAVANASKYAYKIDNGTEQETTNLSVKLENGQSIVVKAVGNGTTYLTGAWSESKTYTITAPQPVTLGKPEVTIGTDGTASWEAIANASKYAYKIDNGTEQETTNLSVKLENGQSIVVKAVGNGTTYLTGAWSESKTYTAGSVIPDDPTPLAKPVLTLNDNEISWAAVEHASGYKYSTDNGATWQDVTGTSVTLQESATVVVKAIGDRTTYSDSPISEPITYTKPAPEPELMTHAQYMAAAKDSTVKVTGVVAGIAGKNVYFQDSDGGYYLYNLSALPEGIAVGKAITAVGKIDVYNGLREIVEATVTVSDTAAVEVTPLDITDIYTAATSLNDANLVNKQSMLVTIKGVTLGTNENDNYSFTLGNNSAVLRIYGAQCIDTEAQTALKALFAANVGKTADITGFVAVYNGNIQIVPAPADTLEIHGPVVLGIPVVTINGEGLAKWNEVPNATGYVCKIAGVDQPTTTELSVQLTDGQTIQVKAIGDGTNFTESDFSESQTYNQPAVLEKLTFTFADISKASTSSYNDTTAKPVFKTACNDATYFEIKDVDKVFPEPVSDVGAIKLSTSKAGGKFTLVFLQDVESIVFNCVAYGSDSCTLAVNGGTEQTVNATAGNVTFTLDSVSKEVKIEAVKRCYIYSITVNFKTVKPLAAPENLKIDEYGVATWDAVTGASSYAYQIGENEVVTVENDGELKSTRIPDGASIKVWAVGDGENYVLKGAEASGTYTLVTVQLDPPEVSINSSTHIASWKEVKGAVGYKYQILDENGTLVGEEVTTTELSVPTALTPNYSIKVMAVGDETVYLSSITYTTKKYEVKIVNLNAPNVDILRDGTVIITDTDGDALSFEYTIDGGAAQTVNNTTSHSVTLDKLLAYEAPATSKTISVKSIGNGDNVKDSATSTDKTYVAPQTCAKPEIATALTGTKGQVTVSWNATDGATAYKYVINNGEETAVPAPETVEDKTVYSVTVALAEGDVFKIKAIGDENPENEPVAPDGNYGGKYNTSGLFEYAAFAIDNTKLYTVDELLTVIGYYGTTADDMPADTDFKVTGVVSTSSYNSSKSAYDIWLKGSEKDKAFELYHAKLADAIEGDYTATDALKNYTVTATGKLTVYNSTKEFKEGCTVDSVDMSAADRVKYAKEELAKAAAPTPDTTADDYTYTLPISGNYGVSITWEFTGLDADNDLYDDTDGTLIITRRDTDATITATATVSYDTESSAMGSIELKVDAKGAVVASTLTFTFTNSLTSDSSSALATNTDVFSTACGNDNRLDSITEISKVYNGKNSSIKFGSGSAIGYVTLKFTAKITSVTINLAKYGSDSGKVQVNDNQSTAATPEATAKDFTFNLATATDTIKIATTTKRCYIYKITVTFEATEAA